MKKVSRDSSFSSISRKLLKLFPLLHRNNLVIGISNEDCLA